MKKLTAKQQTFVDAMVESNFNQSKASEIMGYNKINGPVYASNFIKNPAVRSALTELRKKVEKKTGVTFDYKIEKLLYLVENSDDENVIIKAISELNKMQGHYSAQKIEAINLNVDMDKETLKGYVLQYWRGY
jgi:phage terminase small subunit